MLILLSIGGFSKAYSLEDQVIFAKSVGFDGVDYIATLRDLILGPKKILHLSRKHNVKVRAVHIPLAHVLFAPQFMHKAIFNLLRFFPDSKAFNFHLSGFFNIFYRSSNVVKRFQQSIKEMNIEVSCESNPKNYPILQYYPKETYDPEAFGEFCIKNNISMNLDTSHIASCDYDIMEFFKKYRKHINMLHLSDYLPRKEHLTFEKGNLPLRNFFQEIKKSSFKGVVIFEVFNFPKTTKKEQMLIDIKESLILFKTLAM